MARRLTDRSRAFSLNEPNVMIPTVRFEIWPPYGEFRLY
jgi:hypothetical protein